MNKRDNYRSVELDTEFVVDFLDVRGRDGFVVTITRRPDMGVSIRVRQAGPLGSGVFHDTDFEIDPFDSGEEVTLCSCCGEPAEVNDDDLCEGCAEDGEDEGWRDPAGSDDGEDDASEGA